MPAFGNRCIVRKPIEAPLAEGEPCARESGFAKSALERRSPADIQVDRHPVIVLSIVLGATDAAPRWRPRFFRNSCRGTMISAIWNVTPFHGRNRN